MLKVTIIILFFLSLTEYRKLRMWVFVVVVVVDVGTIENQKSQGGKGTGGAREYVLWMRGRRPSGRGAWIPLPLVLVRKKWRETWVTFRDQPLGQGPPERRESSDQLKKWLLLHCLHTLNRSPSLLLYLLLLFVFLFVFIQNIIFFSLMLFGLCAVVFYKRFSLPFFFIMIFFFGGKWSGFYYLHQYFCLGFVGCEGFKIAICCINY